MTGHRAAGKWRLTRDQQTKLGLGILGAAVIAAAWGILAHDAAASQNVTGSGSQPVAEETQTPEPSPAVTITESATVVVTPDPTDAALSVKPLRDLVAGDRVVYTPEPGGPGVICTWILWDQSIATSTISCGDEPEFQTPTGYLTPVEPRA